MGLSNSTNTKKVYVQTFKQFFIKRTVKENPEAVKRVNRNGDEVYELRYDSLSGSIVDVSITKSEYGERLEISMVDGDETFILTLSAIGAHAFNFYVRMENINYMEPVQFMLWDYDNPFFAVMQDDKLIDKRYAKEDVPKWEAKEVNGQAIWDKTEAFKFYKPKLQELKKQIGLYGNTAKPVEVVDNVDNEENDDLPF